MGMSGERRSKFAGNGDVTIFLEWDENPEPTNQQNKQTNESKYPEW